MMNYFFIKGMASLEKLFIDEAQQIQAVTESEQKFIRESEISSLPGPVQRYLHYTDFAGASQSDVTEVMWAESKIRFAPDKKWMPLTTRQYIFPSAAARLAWMHTRMAGVFPFEGRDRYHNGSGHMYGKLAKIFTVFNNHSQEVALGGAVILLAESLLEPTIALQKYITWEPVDENTAKATLRNKSLEVSGRFYFNDIGEYIRFESDDRPFETSKGKYETRPFSIVMGEYHEAGGYKIPGKVYAAWNLKEGDFTYWEGRISGLKRNADQTHYSN